MAAVPDAPESAPASPDRPNGPWDVSEVGDPGAGGRVDLGAIWLPGRQGMQVRVDVNPQTKQVAAVTAVIGQSALQVQAYAAPRSEGVWDEVREELGAGIVKGGGKVQEAEGPFGTELRARIPVPMSDNRVGVQQVRFLGVDGPRWFLRGALTGQAFDDPEAAAPLEEVFQDVVVVRGDEAMPPRELIPLRLPKSLTPVATPGGGGSPEAGGTDQEGDEQAESAGHAAGQTGAEDAAPGTSPEADEGGQEQAPEREPLRPFERGPEITEIR